MPRKADPDYDVEADRGSAAVFGSTRAAMVSPAEKRDRGEERAGARGLDRTVEQMPGLNRQQKDRERAMPRGAAAEVPDRRMERRLPGPRTMRAPLSSRQRKARSVSKRDVQDGMPDTQYGAVRQLITDSGHRARLNNALSDAAGDVQQLPDRQRQEAQRLDRAIQAYEQRSGRGHLVYVNLELPAAVQGGHPLGVAQAHFPPGSVIELDRYTGGAHSMHELDRPDGGTVPLMEIQTRRGMYLGRSDSLDDTTHLLPRGLRLRVVGMQEAAYRRPDGTTGRRPVIQLRDITE